MNFLDASIFYTRLRTHFRFLYLHCYKHVTIRRFFIGILYIITVFTVGLLSAFFRLIDEILFPNYRNIEVRQPVFIISNPRSGTTFLHRLMCLDDEKFVSNIMYQTIFPSITFFRIIQFINTVDNNTPFKPLHKLLNFINAQLFGGWDDIHATGFNKSEEDEGLHFVSGISPSIGLVTPFLKDFRDLYIPDKLDSQARENIQKYYKSTVQRWMYALGSDKLYLGKTVMSSGRLQILKEIFPDVKIIFLIRNPYQAIPSFTSMFAEPWSLLYPEIEKQSDAYREWGELGMAYYTYFNEQKKNFKEENIITIPYTDLISSPKETVIKIYAQLKMEISPAFMERLDKATQNARTYHSKHSYTLDEYAFDKAYIQNQLKFVFEEYDFEK